MTARQWLLDTVEKMGAMPYRKLCVTWARDVGTKGNVVTWPRPIISAALNELQHCGLISITAPGNRRIADG
jgi:hypothetical protein